MADNIISKQHNIIKNSIDRQNLTYPNQLTVRSWNAIINTLSEQANLNAEYLTKLHQWLIGEGYDDIHIPEGQSFVDYMISMISIIYANYVTTNTPQTISGGKVFTGKMTAVKLTVTDTAIIPNVSDDVRFEDAVTISGPAEMEDSVTIHGTAEFNSDTINCAIATINNDDGVINTRLINSQEAELDYLRVNGTDIESYIMHTRELIEVYKLEHTAQYNKLVDDITSIINLLRVDNKNYDELQEIVNAILANEEEVGALINSIAKKVEKSVYESDKAAIYSDIAKNKLTAGNGIKISSDGVISVSYPNGDEVAY